MIRGFETRSWHNSLSRTLTCPCIREKGGPRSDIGLIPRYSALLFLSRNQACLQGRYTRPFRLDREWMEDWRGINRIKMPKNFSYGETNKRIRFVKK